MKDQAHIRGLDGLRAAAVIAVLVFHVAVRRLPQDRWDELVLMLLKAGWCGVDLFFVLSGFLITGILLDSAARPDYFVRFWWRRALRIFPLYYVYLSLLFAAGLLVPQLAHVLGLQGLLGAHAWFWLYAQNIKIAFDGEWIEPTGLVGHFWSLAVEEQFYLIWPLLVLYLSRRRLLVLSACLIPGALALRVWLTVFADEGTAAYVSTPARADALAAGAVLALLVRGAAPQATLQGLQRWAAPFGLVLVALAAFFDGGLDHMGRATQTIGFTGICIASAGLLSHILSSPSGRMTQVLEHPALTKLGRHSYAIYILHNPLLFGLLIAERRLGVGWTSVLAQVAAESLIVLGASYLFSRLTWTLVEGPALRLKDRVPHWFLRTARAAR